MKTLRLAIASAYAAIISVIGAVVLTIWAEQSAAFKERLAALSGHHWTSKSIFIALGYLIFLMAFYWSFRRVSERKIVRALNLLFWVVILGVIIITGFYFWHFFSV